MKETIGVWLASRAMAERWWEPEGERRTRLGAREELRGVPPRRGWLALARIAARLGGALRGGRPAPVAEPQCCNCET